MLFVDFSSWVRLLMLYFHTIVSLQMRIVDLTQNSLRSYRCLLYKNTRKYRNRKLKRRKIISEKQNTVHFILQLPANCDFRSPKLQDLPACWSTHTKKQTLSLNRVCLKSHPIFLLLTDHKADGQVKIDGYIVTILLSRLPIGHLGYHANSLFIQSAVH